MIEALFDFWQGIRGEIDLFISRMDILDKIYAGSFVIIALAIAWIFWEIITWNNGSSST